jgi:hypothetical protein
LDRDYYGEFMDSYREGKERNKQNRLDKQEQAMKISEMLGEVPPELESDILGPVQPDDPTLAERGIGGLGRLLGFDTEMGQQPEQFEVPEGMELQTKHQRELEKEERAAATASSKSQMQFYRGLLGKKFQSELSKEEKEFQSDLNVEEKQELYNKGLWQPGLSYAQRIEMIHERERAKVKHGTGPAGKKLSAKDKLKNDLYTGKKSLEDLDNADFLILDKFWSSMTPEARAEDALKFAETLGAAAVKGAIPKPSEEEINQMVDRMAEGYLTKQNELIEQIRGERGRGGKGGSGGSATRKERLGNIMNGISQ